MLITPDLLNAILVMVGAAVTWFLSRGKTPPAPGAPTTPGLPSIPTWVPHVDPARAKDIVPGDRPILEGLLAVLLHLVEEQRKKSATPTPAPKETV